jgi:hypothetical protein
MGWGFAPIYVGQQAQGPGSHNVNVLQGGLDAIEAALRAGQAGFPGGSVIFLDIEQGPPATQATLDYWNAWATALEATYYLPGIYCSFSGMAQSLYNAHATKYVWVWNINQFTCDPTQTGLTLIPAGTINFPNPDPAASGVPFAKLWQYVQSNRPGHPCSIAVTPNSISNWDFNSAVTKDPSWPGSDPAYP